MVELFEEEEETANEEELPNEECPPALTLRRKLESLLEERILKDELSDLFDDE